MSTADPVCEPNVLSPKQIGMVRHHLTELTASHAFAGSKRTQDFLHLIVEHTLVGDLDSLRERMIGAEMFGRPVDYDTGSDSVVRVKATEVRKRLAQYYLESGRMPAVRIELPSGSYVPRFIFESLPTMSLPQDDVVPPASAQQKFALGPSTESPESPLNATSRSSARKFRLTPRLLVGAALGLTLIAVIAYAGYRKWLADTNAGQGVHSIAILPLENLSGDSRQEYFADGMTEELINDLGQVSTLRVISMTSAMSYKGTKKKLPDIARELAVDWVVEGGVLREGSQVRISAQLIDARTDRPIWAHTYVHDMTSDLALQGEVAQTIAEEIRTNVTPQEHARLARERPIDPEAQDLYLHGILLREADDCKNAAEYFSRAIAKKPSYAQAHSALASCYGRMGESGRMPYEEAFTRQKAEAIKAIELDDSLSEAHAELANTAMSLDWDWQTAEVEFRRALELNPNSATSHEKYAFYLVRTGHLQEALAEVERSVDLDPVSGSTFHAEGFIYYFSRRYDQALAVTQTVRGLRINLPDWNFLSGDIYAEKGMYAESIGEFIKSGNGPYSLGHLGNAYARSGKTDAALKTISQLQESVRKDGVGRYEIALVYTGLGNKTEAFKWLEESYKAHDAGLLYLKIDPPLDPLRSDPRFDDLVRRVGLAK
ncbi:MAG: tetratricopeptide repeat protein [Terracidiphilus sp.]|jgi:TolB-like protein/Tfp pilus assembly protein PilF